MWVVTEKMKEGRSSCNARGFEEDEVMESKDAPTFSGETLEMF